MDSTISLLKQHKTTRHFKQTDAFCQNDLKNILDAMQQAPSWMNGQHYSVVVVTDENIKSKLSELSPKNPHLSTCSVVLVFCLDMTLQQLAANYHDKTFDIADHSEVLLTTATDTALAMQNAIIASESLGYGTVCVGGIRQVARDVINLLHLPKYVFPLCALCIGVVDDSIPVEQVKPRIVQSVKIHTNHYVSATIDDVLAYDNTMRAFAEARETMAWSEKFASYYAQNPNVLTDIVLKEQGF